MKEQESNFENKKKLLPLQKLSLGPEAIFENKNWLLERQNVSGANKAFLFFTKKFEGQKNFPK